MKFLFLFFIFFFVTHVSAQGDSEVVKVHFFYGSKPKKNFRDVEKKRFGGLHGGHVSVQIGDSVFSFKFIGKVRVFGAKKNLHHHWITQAMSAWIQDTINNKYASIVIPLSYDQFAKLKSIQQSYCGKDPYDYAFLGMRCAAAVYDVFSQLEFFKPRSRLGMIRSNFYPKMLRKRFLKLASNKKWVVLKHDGSERRKWER